MKRILRQLGLQLREFHGCLGGGQLLAGLQYLTTKQESPHIVGNLAKIKKKVGEINSSEECRARIEILSHDSVLRYSFVSSERVVWIKPYRNSLGDAHIPALQIAKNSPLFEFYSTDIQQFKAQARDAS